VLKAIKRLSLLRGDKVMVAGQGPIGLMFTRLLKIQGIKVIATDLLESRLKLARHFGAKWTSVPSTLDFRRSPTLDAAILAVPSDAALREAVHSVRGAGQIMLFAHTKRGAVTELDLSSVCVDEKALLGSYSADLTLQREVARLVFSRQLDVQQLITHRFPLGAASEAIKLASHPSAESLKIVVLPSAA
jgi:L-iditol 2-dehydrogenase